MKRTRHGTKPISRWRLAVAGLVLAVLQIAIPSPVAAGSNDGSASPPRSADAQPRIAVFPVVNLSGILADVGVVETNLRSAIEESGLALLADDELEALFDRHRVRYVAGIERSVARALREEAGVDAALLTSVDLLDDLRLPRVALTARLVTTDNDPTIRWMDFVVLAGDDSPGLFDLGVIRDPQILAGNAVAQLVRSLESFLGRGARRKGGARAARRHRPRELYVDPETLPSRERAVRVAVVPFTNQTDRRQSGELIQLQLIRAMVAREGVVALEPGVVRRFLLDRRIIPARGVSLTQADAFREALDVDWVISGNVFGFDDGSITGVPPARVSFSATVVDARKRRVVATAFSGAGGTDGLVLFGRGRIRSASGVAAELATGLVQQVLKQRRSVSERGGPVVASAP